METLRACRRGVAPDKISLSVDEELGEVPLYPSFPEPSSFWLEELE